MSEEKRLAVLIDSDNVSAKYAQFVMQEVVKYGNPTYKRVYGDWEKGGNGWHAPAINYSIMPVQQTCYVAGKNATDFSMIIDAMDILYTGKVDGFVLVTSDSDFTRLAIRLREAGMFVVGIGELKTPRAFTASCNHFCYLNQVCESEGTADEQTIRKAVIEFVTEHSGERLDLAKIFAVLTSKFGNINFDEMGYKRFSNFIDSFRELRRSNTFVTLRKKREERVPSAAVRTGEPTEQDIKAAIAEYFEKNPPVRDNMMKLESYLMSIFGRIDYSRFGSKRFAKFIDRLDGFTRNGTDIAPAGYAAEKPEERASAPAAEKAPAVGAGQKPSQRAINQAAEPEELKEKPTFAAAEKLTLKYAAVNMPDGGNMGQLNNELMAKFGKDYLAVLGADEIKALLSQMKDIRVRRNHVFLTDAKYAEWDYSAQQDVAAKERDSVKAAEVAEKDISEKQQVVAESDNEQDTKNENNNRRRHKRVLTDREENKVSQEKLAEQAEQTNTTNEKESASEQAARGQAEQPVPEKEQTKPSVPEQPAEKADINAVKREILHYTASEDSPTLSGLGTVLSEKYGKGWLKALGYGSVKKLIGEVKGVGIKGNVLSIDEEFAKRTEEIEKFVNEFARAEGSRSVRALSSKLKSKFEGFDFSDYGFARFTDFVNAIDGVKADRYHIRSVDEE